MELRGTRNVLLRYLSTAARKRLEPDMVEYPLAFKQPLIEQGTPASYVYFPESGVVSMVTDLDDGSTVETGTVGNEGFVGLSAVLGGGRSPGRAFCQIPGTSWRLPAGVIGAELDRNTDLFRLLLRYANFVTAMIGQTAACNRMHHVDARMSRWLLMTHDRVDVDDFPLTQEFLASMLGVARPTVNIAGATLQRAGFIKYMRGRITVIDRKGLESASCECYQRIRNELDAALDGRATTKRLSARPSAKKK